MTCMFLKKNYRPSEHPPARGGNVKTFSLGGIIGCKISFIETTTMNLIYTKLS